MKGKRFSSFPNCSFLRMIGRILRATLAMKVNMFGQLGGSIEAR
jgi:hypothetical protein